MMNIKQEINKSRNLYYKSSLFSFYTCSTHSLN